MEENIFSPVTIFFLSIAFGVILSVLLDFFKIINMFFTFNKILSFIQDVLYLFLAGVLTFLFLLAVNNGEIRYFVFLGELLGWMAWHNTLGKYFLKFAEILVYFLKKSLKKIWDKLPKPEVNAGLNSIKGLAKKLKADKLFKFRLNLKKAKAEKADANVIVNTVEKR